MEKELQESIINDCPIIYKSGERVSVGKGWYQLVRTLSLRLEALAAEMTPEAQANCHVSQIKEKFGGLRFYMAGTTNEMEKLIDEAEAESYKTCEACGEPGRTREGGWVKVLCNSCERQRESKGF